jgi:FkbM family methyltransferase
VFTSSINKFLTRFMGVKISRSRPTFEQARNFILGAQNISFVIDGGANRGQWAREVIKDFPEVRMLSIEPISEAFNELRSNASEYSNWTVINVALSNLAGKAVMNVANNDEQSSSLLKPDIHLMHYPTVEFPRTQETNLITLDSLQVPEDAEIYLKLDLQGNELSALQGGIALLDRVKAIELEMSTVQMYAQQPTFLEVANFLDQFGFQVFTFSDVFRSPEGQCIYFDVIFQKEPSGA